MRTVGNILWLILVGWHTALAWLLAGLVLCVTIIGIPFGVQCFKIAGFSLWPFGRSIVARPGVRVLGVVGNVVWCVLAGVWIAIGYVLSAILLCITIIGIPFAVQAFKLAGVALVPFVKEVVRTRDLTLIQT
jgi:uncharacterized membrane protein YccF (DUF307 family)